MSIARLIILLFTITLVLAHSYPLQHHSNDKKNETILFLHVGKAGGGTVMQELRKRGVSFRKCHPHPCPRLVKSQRFSNIMVAIRDPVDRFVSAFYWRIKILCHAENETRIRYTKQAVKNPKQYCRDGRPKEALLLRERYKSNPNILAEALCSNESEQAQKHMRRIAHANHFLVDWLMPRDENTSLIAIVQEPGFDFISQIHSAIDWITNQTNVQGSWNDTTTMPPAASQHSSGHNVTSTLSPLGTCCMARHLRQDYQLLQNMKDQLCSFNKQCHDTIASILKRRSHVFNTQDSCVDENLSSRHESHARMDKTSAGDSKTKDTLLFSEQAYTRVLWLLEIVAVVIVVGIYSQKCKTRGSTT